MGMRSILFGAHANQSIALPRVSRIYRNHKHRFHICHKRPRPPYKHILSGESPISNTSRFHRMDYYQCPAQDLYLEARRRRFPKLLGSQDQLHEGLMHDDKERGSDATTVSTADQSAFLPRTVNLSHKTECDDTNLASRLVNESACTKCVAYEGGRADCA